MSFSAWSENDPAGSDAASSINEAATRAAVRIRERLAGIIPDWTTATDRIHQEKMFINTNGLTIRDDTDANTLASINQNGIFTLNKQPACYATDASHSVTNSIDNAIDFTEVIDVGGMHDNATNPSRFIAPVTGLYAISARFTFGVQTTYKIRRDGTTTVVGPFTDQKAYTGEFIIPFSIVSLTATQYVELVVNPTVGGSVVDSSFTIFKIA